MRDRYEDVVIIRYSEIAVKGPATRARMESLLASNLLDALSECGCKGDVRVEPGRVLVWSPRPDPDSVARAASRVFGVKSASPAASTTFTELDDLVEAALGWFSRRVAGKVFRVRARRTGSHPFTSKDVERALGAALLEAGGAGVDLESPEYTAYVEIRGNRAFFYDRVIEGPGGLPLGSEDPILVLYSGGFDSTVTAWLLMRRGSPVVLAYYDLGHAGSLRVAVEAAVRLATLWAHGHDLRFARVDFSWVAREVATLIRPEYRLLVLRRLMLEHASKLAPAVGAEALATGDSVGQVASQTVRNLRLIGSMLPLPVLRPVAGMDKDEVAKLAQRIGVYDIVARQVEVCGRDAAPTPKADPEVFYSELARAKDRVDLDEARVAVASLRGRNPDDVIGELAAGQG